MFEFKDPGRLIDGDLELVLVEEYAGDPDIGFIPAYRFEMRLTAADTKVGNTHHIVMYGGHIAYGVLPEQRGHRYAARACRLLFPLARGHDLKTIRITCNPDHIASARRSRSLICRRIPICVGKASARMPLQDRPVGSGTASEPGA